MVKTRQMRYQDRVDVLGVSEPNIQVESGNRIRVQLAGVEEPRVRTGTTFHSGKSSFRDADEICFSTGMT